MLGSILSVRFIDSGMTAVSVSTAPFAQAAYTDNIVVRRTTGMNALLCRIPSSASVTLRALLSVDAGEQNGLQIPRVAGDTRGLIASIDDSPSALIVGRLVIDIRGESRTGK